MGWGISKLMGLEATILFLICLPLKTLGFIFSSILFLYASLITLMVSISAHPFLNRPMLLGKKPDGSFPLFSFIIFSPFLYSVRLFSSLRRLFSGEPLYTEICEGVYVGGWPSFFSTIPPGNPAIVDCTCELPRSSKFLQNEYLCIPTWDTRAPTPNQIEAAVRWALRKREQGRPIFFHCAYGHGRSVAVCCAFLVALGLAEDWKVAEMVIKERRPFIRMNDLHGNSLKDWSNIHLPNAH